MSKAKIEKIIFLSSNEKFQFFYFLSQNFPNNTQSYEFTDQPAKTTIKVEPQESKILVNKYLIL